MTNVKLCITCYSEKACSFENGTVCSKAECWKACCSHDRDWDEFFLCDECELMWMCEAHVLNCPDHDDMVLCQSCFDLNHSECEQAPTILDSKWQ